MEKEEVAKNSIGIQENSLMLFAQALDCELFYSKKGVTFKSFGMCMGGYPYISLHSMVLLHNSIQNATSVDGKCVVAHVGQKVFGIPTYFANRAIASKVVESVDLSVDKEARDFKTTKQWVKFVNGSEWLCKDLWG